SPDGALGTDRHCRKPDPRPARRTLPAENRARCFEHHLLLCICSFQSSCDHPADLLSLLSRAHERCTICFSWRSDQDAIEGELGGQPTTIFVETFSYGESCMSSSTETIKFDICCAGRALYRAGLSAGVAGHISVATGPDRMLMNRFGPSFGTL